MSETEIFDSKEFEGFDFYDLAAKFAEETSNSDRPHRLLKLWAHRFPEHAADLAAIAYARLVEPEPGSEQASAAEELEIIASAQRVLDRFKSTVTPLTSLVVAANTAGLTPKTLAESLRIDLPLFAKLEQCLLDVKSIPSLLVNRLASSIGRSTAEVISYLSGPPRLASNASYKSQTAPSVSEDDRQSFSDALASSRMISAENRQYWLDQLSSTNDLP